MDLTFSREDQLFRQEARAWLEANIPRDRHRPHSGPEMRAFDLDWQRQQYEGGWAGVAWPQEYGGLGLSAVRQLIFYEEYAKARGPDQALLFCALNHAAPTIMARGTEAQKDFHLPKILKGEVAWCQGFSEPNAGSDLASLKTRAVIDGDDLVVSGSKIWTSNAHLCDYQELLVRTDAESPKHRAISWVICDMRTPGIELRPILIMTGPDQQHFCQVFYNDVRIPLSNVVGELNEGWTVAMATLGFERGTGTVKDQIRFGQVVERLIEMARERAGANVPWDHDEIAARLAAVRADLAAVRAMTYVIVSRSQHGPSGPETSLMKAMFSQVQQTVRRLSMDILGSEALEMAEHEDWVHAYLRSYSATIAAGTTEIQNNIIGERLLGLPRMN
jgi:alkylation response protein AidB-like acyl-CoA dehydrogenase